MSETTVDAFEAKRNEIKASKPKPYEKKEITYDKKNYVNTKLEDNELEKEFQLRIIPLTNDSDDIFEEVYFHWDNKAQKSLVCPKRTKHVPDGTNKECPYCDVEEGFWAEYRVEKDETRKKSYMASANEHKAQPSSVFRTIQRENGISDGPKFWKVSEAVVDDVESAKNQNKKANINIFDLKTGKDLFVKFKKEEKKQKNGKTKLQTKYASLYADLAQTPALEDEKLLNEWVSDEKKWYNVFTLKSYEFMEIVLNGGEPWFHKPLDKWIDKKDLKAIQEEAERKVEEQAEEQTEDTGESEYDNEAEETTTVGSTTPQEEDDLPF